MSTTPSIQSSTRTPALARIGVASDPGSDDTGLNDDFETARTHSPGHELNDGELRPLNSLSEEGREDALGPTMEVAPNASQEEDATESDEEVDKGDDPSYSPGDRSLDETPSGLLHFAYRRPLGVSTSAVSKSKVNNLDPNGGQCLLTRDLAKETGIDNAHLLPQAWNNKPELITRCEWALGQKYKSLHVDEPRNIMKIRKDWHFNYDQKKFMLMPTLETIEAFETRREALELSPSDDPPDIMALYGEEDIFEYRLVPLTADITNIFRFDRDGAPVLPAIPNAGDNTSNSNPVPPTGTPDADGAISDLNTVPLITPNTDRLHSESDLDAELSSIPVANNNTSVYDPSPPTTHEADGTASNSNFVAPDPGSHLFAQDDNSDPDADASAFNTDDPFGDALTELDLPAAKTNWACHCWPFDTLPVLRSHALPHFVLLNAGEKLVGIKLQTLAPVVARIFKVNRREAMGSLATMYHVYNSWIQAVVPSRFYSKPPPPLLNHQTIKLGKNREQAEAGTAEQSDGQVESVRSMRVATRQQTKEAQTSHTVADTLNTPEIPAHAPIANAEGSGEPTAISSPALESSQAVSSVVPTVPAETSPPTDAVNISVPAPVEPIVVPLYSQVAAARKSVTSEKAPIGTSTQARRGVPTKIPTAILTNAWNRAEVAGTYQPELGQSGQLAAGSGILIQSTTAAQENSTWTTVRHRSPPAGSKNKDSRRAPGSLRSDSVTAHSRALDAGEMASQDETLTTAKRSQAVSESLGKGTEHASGYPSKGKVSPRANIPHAGASATLNIPVRDEGDSQHQTITRPLPASSLGLSSANQDTQTTGYPSNHRHDKSGGEGALEDPPEQKRRRVTRPSEGEAALPSSRIPLPAKSKKFIDRMKPKMTPSMSNRRVSFAQDQEEDPPVASGSQGMTEKMPVNVTRTQDKDETTGDRRDSGSKHTDDNEQDGKGRKSSKSGKKRRYSRRSLGETI